MATTVSYSASMRTRKTNSASNAKSSAASQEYYENTYNYVGIVHFAGMATPIPLANGGTGASSAKAALSNLGVFYSTSLPSSGTDGQICLVPV